MRSRIILSFLLIILFCALIALYPKNTQYKVKDTVSPIDINFDNQNFKYSDIDTFDDKYTEHNKELAHKFNLTEDEAFILGNLGKYWTKSILLGRIVNLTKDDIVYNKFSYKVHLEKSPFCIKDGKFTNKEAFLRQINSIRKSKFVIVDMDTDNIYPVSKENSERFKNFIVIRKSQVKNLEVKKERTANIEKKAPPTEWISENIKVYLSDLTSKLKPDRNCDTNICKEIVSNINSSKNSIDIAIYGYSAVPAIEKALENAINRGVNVRLVYDSDRNGENIYPDTKKITTLIPQNISDINSSNPDAIMHNKFYIFDNKILITGSANLSHTDISGFNSNSVIVIHSPEIAKIYKDEFDQMFSNKFHKDKSYKDIQKTENLTICFSPQNSTTTNIIIPAIINAKKYIYAPTFIITEKRIAEELIKAKKRGVDVRIILDALSASVKHSKLKELRGAGVQVKVENYAGKMHSKSMIIDDKYVIIGSMNFSYSGENKNDENTIMIENPEIAKFYKQFFLYQWSRIPDKWLKYTPKAESIESIGSCSDGIDNDYDGLTDMEDERCKK